MRILFSAVGFSDPVCAGHDGGWLHCCRHIHPDQTVVYMTAETWQREQKLQMYSRSLELLNSQTGDNTAFVPVARPDLFASHDFDAFYGDFEQILLKLHQDNPEAEVFLNISSGTPAIKSTMILMYHLLPFPTTLLQVDRPHEELGSSRGERETVPDDYDPEAGWKSNLDNQAEAHDRCHVHQSVQQSLRLQHMQLQALIEKNEHHAARLLAKRMGDYCSKSLYHGLTGAEQRMQLDIVSAGNELYQSGWQEAENLQKKAKDPLFLAAEAVLTMQCDLDRRDIAGCIRKLTPVLFTLLCHYLETNCHIDYSKITNANRSKIIEYKLSTVYPNLYAAVKCQLFNRGNPMFGSSNIIVLIKACQAGESDLLKMMEQLRDVEANARNEVAHTCRMLTETAFKKETGIPTAEMMRLIHDCFQKIQPVVYQPDFWNSYDRMNGYLTSLLFHESDEQ